jgi:uncharacterized protein (TIGR00255 family)
MTLTSAPGSPQNKKMKSMTGFGLGLAATLQGQIEISLRSVNGRFLEPRFHVPREFLAVENELKQILAKYMNRGTVDIFLSRKQDGSLNQQKVQADAALAAEYLAAHRALGKKLKLPVKVTLESLARWPDVLKAQENSILQEEDLEAAKEAMKKACEAALKERAREGQSLKAEMENLIRGLAQQVDQVEELRKEANLGLEEKLEQRIQQRLQKMTHPAGAVSGGTGIDGQRISLELSFLLERADINEEIMRLREHLKNYQELIAQPGPIGKKLDFYTQELLREMNTIGSKSNLSKLTQIVVEAKTMIERLREQVQNIE